jgi:Ca-activated chloride channel homolog
MMRSLKVLWIVFLLALSARAQIGQPGRNANMFDVMMKQGGIMDYRMFEELNDRSNKDVTKRSEATVSRFDLKAPGKARSDYNKGLQFLMRDDLENAANRFNKAIAIYPEFVSAHNALGCVYFKQKKNDLAREQFASAARLDDHLSSSFLNLGRIDLAMGNFAGAQTALEKAHSIAPLDSSLPVILAYAQYLNHEFAAAIKTAEQAHARSHPGTALVHYFSAAAWQAQGHSQETQAELQTYLSEDPNSAFAGPVRQMIEQLKAQPAIAGPQTTVAWEASDSTPSMFGQKVLQDIKEKKEIAEAETEEMAGAPAPFSESRPVELPGSKGDTEGLRNQDRGWTFHSVTEEVAVFFTATDHGRSVTDLRTRDISITDDEKPPAAVLGLHSESALPLRLGLLIDTSVSVTDRFGFEQAAAKKFLRRTLTGKDDRAFVAGFSNSVVMAQDFTGDTDLIAHGIQQLVPVGGTAIWDAVSFAVDKLAEEKSSQPMAKVLVVISDGDDNSSTATLKQAIERAERNEVVVYTVSTRNAEPGDDNEITGNRAMRLLAGRTGGAAFFPGSPDRLNHSLEELQQFVRSRYLVAYKPASFQHDGRYRAISITATKSGRKLKVNSRKGYYADAAVVR